MNRYLVLAITMIGLCTSLHAQSPLSFGCPNIKIVEPSGVAMFGDTVDFRIEPELQQLKDIQIEWKVSSGTIEKGAGTSTVVIRSVAEPKIHVIVAQAIVKGLPKECKSVFEGSAVVGCCIDPILIDEFGKLPVNDQKGRIDNVLEELRQNPNNTGVFILRSKKGETEIQLLKRVKFIKDFVFGYRKFPKPRIVIASDPHPYVDNAVRIYRMPPEVDARIYCSDCRFF